MPAVAEVLRMAGLRATPQRVRILTILHAGKRPRAVEDIVRAGKGAFDTTTAYRTLETLKAKGIVRTIALNEARALYELAGDHHHHAVCTSCGLIKDVSACVAPTFSEKVRATVGFNRITSHALEFFGTCRTCAKK